MSRLNDALQRLEQRAASPTERTTVRIDPPTRLARGLRGPTARNPQRQVVTKRTTASVVVADTHLVVGGAIGPLATIAYEVTPSSTLLGTPLTVIADAQGAFLSIDVERDQSLPWKEDDKVRTVVKEAETDPAQDIGDPSAPGIRRRHHPAHASPRPSSAFLAALAEARPSEPPAERCLPSQAESEDVANHDTKRVTCNASPIATPEPTVSETVAPSQVAADIQAVATSILGAIPDARPATLLLTSAEPRDSLSGILGSLLIAMAEQREDPVLAIDASGDGELARRFSSTQKLALKDRRPKQVVTATPAWHETIIQTSVPGLCLLSPDLPESPIDPRDIPLRMEDLHARFGLVLVAIDATDGAALRMWSPSCTGSYLLVRSQSLSWQKASALRHRMVRTGTELFGCILVVG